MKIFFEGDLQIYKSFSEYQSESARFEATKLYIEWVLNNPKLNNKEVIYFSLGDFFENSLPSPEEYNLGLHYLSNGEWKEKYLLAGNHDYNRIKDSYSIDPFSKLPNTTLIKKPGVMTNFGDLRVLTLPYYYDHIFTDLKSMKEEYENMSGEYDLVVTHIQDESQEFGDRGSIDISKLKGNRIQGHIHAVENNLSGYVNSPIPCTKGEVLDKRYCFLYDTETKWIEKIEIPNFLGYEEVIYPNELKEPTSPYTLYTIKDYVDKASTIDFYKSKNPDMYIKEMVRKKLQTLEDFKAEVHKKTTLDYWEDYSLENKVDEQVYNLVLNKLKLL